MLIAIPLGIAAGHPVRALAGPPAGRRRAAGDARRRLAAGVLPGPPPPGPVLPDASTCCRWPAAWTRDLRFTAPIAAGHRLPDLSTRCWALNCGRLHRRHVAPGAAGADAGGLPHRAHRADDARLDARGAGPGLRPDGARRTASGSGGSSSRLALRNALLPVLTVIGLVLAYSLTGTFFVEVVFNWPGLGHVRGEGHPQRGLPGRSWASPCSGRPFYVVVNLAVDLLQAWLDPRIRLA